MAIFKFYQDYTYTRTCREYYNIEADSLEEARNKAAEVANLDDCEDAEYLESKDLETNEDSIYEYHNREIKGIYDEDGEEI